MSAERTTPPLDDLLLPFHVGRAGVRGRIVRLGPAVDDIVSRHAFPQPLTMLLGEAAALVALLGASLKFDGKLILQAQGDGPVPVLVADYVAGGAVRATATLAPGREAEAAAVRGPDLAALIGKGQLALTIDQGAGMERYQGVTPLDGATLAEAAMGYFEQSEQIPTAIKLSVGRVERPGEPGQWRAGGVMVQYMPGEGGERERGEAVLLEDDDRDAWERAVILMETTQADELVDPEITPEELLFRLYHEDGVRAFEAQDVRFACPCSREKVAAVLNRYPVAELESMAEDGVVRVTCDFCRAEYEFDPVETAAPADAASTGARTQA